MSDHELISARYTSNNYLNSNPSWDIEDSPWKAGKVKELLTSHAVTPKSIVDVGCGAGLVLTELKKRWPDAGFFGYDIAPDAERFWAAPRENGINLFVGDFTRTSSSFDVILALDVLEHLQDPFAFLAQLKGRANHYVFHFPLDLSAISVLRESPLLLVRHKVGHIHYYTRGLATALLEDCGYRIVDARYTGASFNAPQRTFKTWLASVPRRLARLASPDWGVRLFGGETLMVLATTKTGA
jgi:SAM-dependent methyltransferase